MWWCFGGTTWRCTPAEALGLWLVVFFYMTILVTTAIHMQTGNPNDGDATRRLLKNAAADAAGDEWQLLCLCRVMPTQSGIALPALACIGTQRLFHVTGTSLYSLLLTTVGGHVGASTVGGPTCGSKRCASRYKRLRASVSTVLRSTTKVISRDTFYSGQCNVLCRRELATQASCQQLCRRE